MTLDKFMKAIVDGVHINSICHELGIEQLDADALKHLHSISLRHPGKTPDEIYEQIQHETGDVTPQGAALQNFGRNLIDHGKHLLAQEAQPNLITGPMMAATKLLQDRGYRSQMHRLYQEKILPRLDAY